MATETSELILKFVTQGVGDVGQASAAVKKLTTETEEAGKRVDAIGKTLSSAGKAGKEAGNDFSALGQKLRDGIQNPVGAAQAGIDSFLGGLGKVGVVAGVAALGVGLVAKSTFEFIKAQGAAAEQSINFADRLGISIGKAEQLQAAFRIAGVNAGALEGSARTLSAALEDPAGAGEKTVRALRELGVATHTLKGEQRELGPVLLDTLQALGKITSDTERVTKAQAVLTRAGATEFLPYIKNLEELNALVVRLGVGLDENITRKLANNDDLLGSLSEKVTIVARKLAEPILAPLNSVLGFILGGQAAGGTGAALGTGIAPKNTGPVLHPGTIYGQDSPAFKARVAEEEALERLRTGYQQKTSRGIQATIQEKQKELAQQEAIFFGKGADLGSATRARSEAERLISDIAKLEAQLKKLGETAKEVNLSQVFTLGAFDSIAPGSTGGPAGLIKLMEDARKAQAEFHEDQQKARERMASLPLNELNSFGFGGTPRVGRSEENVFNPDRIAKILEDLNKIRDDGSKSELDHRIRMISLGDNEYENALRIRNIRTDTQQAERDFQYEIARIEKERIEKYQEQARGVYRSLRQGGTSGLGAFIRGQADQVAEQLFVNVAGQTFQRFGGALGKAGGASGLPDWLLKGTLLDPQNDQKLSLDTNTAATDRNTAAMDRTAAALTSGGGGGFNLSLPGGGGGGSIFDGFDPATGKWAKGTPGTGLSGWQRVAGYGTAIAGGAFGVASGVREGGFGGGLTAGSAGLGATAGILSLAGVTGPAAPILAGIGIGLAVIKAFIPDAAKTFYAEQDKLIASRQFTAPDAMSRGLDFATGGTPIEANFRGQSRVIVSHVITLNVTAMDAQSIMDRKDDLADAVAAATAGGSIPMTSAINQTVFGAGS